MDPVAPLEPVAPFPPEPPPPPPLPPKEEMVMLLVVGSVVRVTFAPATKRKVSSVYCMEVRPDCPATSTYLNAVSRPPPGFPMTVVPNFEVSMLMILDLLS